jgi:hypothetical protein
VAEGDLAAAATLDEHDRAEAEATADAEARAASRRRFLKRLRERLGPKDGAGPP